MPLTGASAPAKKGFGGFLSHVKDAASRVVDDTSKNLNQASNTDTFDHISHVCMHMPDAIFLLRLSLPHDVGSHQQISYTALADCF